jgi:hypothetical protein
VFVLLKSPAGSSYGMPYGDVLLSCLFSICLEGDNPLDIVTHCSINCSLGFPVAAILTGAARLFVFLFGHLKLVLITFASYVPPILSVNTILIFIPPPKQWHVLARTHYSRAGE